MDDLFPGLDCPRVRYPRLNDEVEAELAAAGYQVCRALSGRGLESSSSSSHILVCVLIVPARHAQLHAGQGKTPTQTCRLSTHNTQVLTAPGDQVDKVVQLYEVMLTRHTTMVVGQTGGGKSVILQALARAQVRSSITYSGSPGRPGCSLLILRAASSCSLANRGSPAPPATADQARLGRKTTLNVLNPKAISVAELYGVLDKDTRDWTDGLLSNIFRRVQAGDPYSWLCLHDQQPDAVITLAVAQRARVRLCGCALQLTPQVRNIHVVGNAQATPYSAVPHRREQNKPLPPDRDEARYIVFDGDVDAVSRRAAS